MDTGNWFDFAGQTVVVTGGAGGIGREICAAFAEHGAHVVVADLDGDAAAAVAASAGSAEPARVDNTDAAAVGALADDVVARHGKVDVLVNTPAITYRRTALELFSME